MLFRSASYLMGIETPLQMQRDPLMGSLFENLVVTEAVKARCNYGSEPNLYFFRNSKGLEIDLILKENRLLHLFEIKSGKALNEAFTTNMIKFRKLYDQTIAQEETHGTVIYSGEHYESYKDFAFRNFHQTEELFKPKETPFVLTF